MFDKMMVHCFYFRRRKLCWNNLTSAIQCLCKVIQHLLIPHKLKSYICSNGCVIHHMLNRILHDHVFVIAQHQQLVSRSIHFCRQNFILQWLLCHVYKGFDNFTQIFIYTKVGKFQKSITKGKEITHLISFNCTVFITGTYKWSQLNSLDNWMHFKIAETFSRLTRKGYDCMTWSV